MPETQEPFIGEDGLSITAVHEPYPRDRFLAWIPYAEMAKLLADEKTGGVLGFPVMYAIDDAGKVYVWPTPSGASSPWHPISTAPKDGTKVLMRNRQIGYEDTVSIARFSRAQSHTGDWIAQADGDDAIARQWHNGDIEYLVLGHPVAWMPLPAPPEAT